MIDLKTEIRPDKGLAAACGLFCPACTLYIGTREDPVRLKDLADRFSLPLEEMQCDGCRAERRHSFCQQCKMIACTREKGIDFCGQCEEYPCEELKAFQAAMPHRIELWESQARLKEVGFEAWFRENLRHYACPDCGTLNSAYDRSCRACGREPSCEYVKLHRLAIGEMLKKNV